MKKWRIRKVICPALQRLRAAELKLYLAVSVLMTIRNDCSGDFPGGPVVKNPPSNAGDAGLIPGRGTRFPHGGGGAGS